MSVRLTSSVDNSALQAVKERLRSAGVLSNNSLRKAVKQRRPQLLRKLAERNAVKYPIQWKSEKQRRYVLGYVLRDANGNFQPTRRTGATGRDWTIEFILTPQGGSFIIENPRDYVKFLGGSLAQNRSAALRFKQPFHDNSGYPDYTDVVQREVNKIIELWRDGMVTEWVKPLQVRSRAFTSGRRR